MTFVVLTPICVDGTSPVASPIWLLRGDQIAAAGVPLVARPVYLTTSLDQIPVFKGGR